MKDKSLQKKFRHEEPLSKKYRLSAHLMYRQSGSTLRIVNKKTNSCVELEGLAGEMFKCFDGGRTLDEMKKKFLPRKAKGGRGAEAEFEFIVGQMIALGLIDPSKTKA